jgi:hypothetical protein
VLTDTTASLELHSVSLRQITVSTVEEKSEMVLAGPIGEPPCGVNQLVKVDPFRPPKL